jgi:adsorption protein B
MALARFGDADCRIYVGCYPNDPATLAAVRVRAARDPRVRPVVCTRPGPTTKADCLNHLWRAMLADEVAGGVTAKAVVLHDAEDVVHAAEPAIFDRLIEAFDLVQLPVLPLIDPGSRWIAGHYADAFAEAHGKTLVVREAIGAAMPSAGVGCAIGRQMLGRIAAAAGGAPFDPASLTEDYEIGLKVHALGGRGIFVRLPGAGGGAVVAIREYFPATFATAVRQKARWMAGIALDGWDRMGWRGGIAERWMRLRDRRAPIAMIVLAAGYAALVLWVACYLGGMTIPDLSAGWRALLWANAGLVAWRMAVRMGFVAHAYGWREGMRAGPRMIVGNIVDMAAARRGIMLYLRGRRDGGMRWEKTAHRFPDVLPGA